MLPEQILTVFIVPRFFHKSNVKSLRSVFRRRETKVERTLYSTITNPNKRSKSLFPRRRPPLLLKGSECRSISGIIGSRFVAAPKNNSMTSPPLGRCYLFSTKMTLVHARALFLHWKISYSYLLLASKDLMFSRLQFFTAAIYPVLVLVASQILKQRNEMYIFPTIWFNKQ